MLLKAILAFCVCTSLCSGEDDVKIYDTYTGLEATEEQLAFYKSVNQLGVCTTKVKKCDPDEWRRMDGTCNNLKYPSTNAVFNRMYRMLPASFFNGTKPRKAVNGEELPNPRNVRVRALKIKRSVHPKYTVSFPGYGVFTFNEIGSPHDIQNYLAINTQCCVPEHMNDNMCAPNLIQDDDPTHQYDDIRCMNLTRPLTYQDYGCTKDSVPSPISKSTQSYDLSHIYNKDNQGDAVMRTFSDGMLIVEEIDGKIWPQNGPKAAACPLNAPDENICFKYQTNGLLMVQLITIWYVRHHNYICGQLAAVNPCWDDEMLFQVARDINIAFSQQLYFYEWLPCLIDRKELIEAGIIGDKPGHRDVYDENLHPSVPLEFIYALRWFHVIQESVAKKYDCDGNYVGSYPSVNLTFRTGNLEKDGNLEKYTQGCFRQPTSDFDHCVDHDIAEQGLGPIQRALDITTSDLHKGRLFGIAPYIDYLYHCTGIKINTFEDFVRYKIMNKKEAAVAEEIYKEPANLDALAGMWLERGTIVLSCIFKDAMLRAVKSDGYQFERPNRPHAFTKAQLLEIRKAKYSLLMCTVADGVTGIQPNAFINISPDNPLTECADIPHIDFRVFAACNTTLNKTTEYSSQTMHLYDFLPKIWKLIMDVIY